MRLFFFFAVFFLLAMSAIFSQTYLQYDRAYLAGQGIDLNSFKITGFSGDHRTLLAIEHVNNLALRAKGFVWVLRALRLNQNNQLTGIQSALLHISDLDNLAVDESGTKALVAGQHGTEILEVNLNNGKTKILFSHQESHPGFRTRQIMWYYKGDFYSVGYFYDAQGYWVSDAVVKLDLSHPNSQQFFQKTWDIGRTRSSLGIMQFELDVSGTEGFLGARKSDSKEVALYHYKNGEIMELDSSPAYGGWAATSDRILYAALRKLGTVTSGERELLIKDTKLKKTWILYDGVKAYLYPYLSSDGKVAVVAEIKLNGTMSYYYAKESENFTLTPFPNLQDIPWGIFRLSPDGKSYSYLNRDGVIIGSIP